VPAPDLGEHPIAGQGAGNEPHEPLCARHPSPAYCKSFDIQLNSRILGVIAGDRYILGVIRRRTRHLAVFG
jgi:hypothetical protein